MKEQPMLSHKTQKAIAEYSKLLADEPAQKLFESKLLEYFSAFKDSFVNATRLLNVSHAPHLETLQNPDAFMEAMSNAQTIAEMCGFSPRELSLWYAHALEYFQKGHYENAKDCFLFLVALCPIVSDFWISLSLSFFYLHDEESAKWASFQAILVAPDEIDGYLCFARISCEHNEHALALEMLEQAASESSDPEFQKALLLAKQEVKTHKTKRGL
jgi:hypothetical protein